MYPHTDNLVMLLPGLQSVGQKQPRCGYQLFSQVTECGSNTGRRFPVENILYFSKWVLLFCHP